jgi:NAD(P)H-hydrate epimerase
MREIRADERTVVTAGEQRRLDALAGDRGVSQETLVESAGGSAAEWILKHGAAERVAVLAGPGGNGADALVAARRLREAGRTVDSYLFAPGKSASEPLRGALARLLEAGECVHPADGEHLAAMESLLADADLVIDGLYGSGLSRSLDGTAAELVRRLNDCAKRIVSLDVPSGVEADSGDVPGPVVQAGVTLAMEFLKPAHLLFPAAGLCGYVDILSVAYPEAVRASAAPWARVLGPHGARRRLPARPPEGHKGTFGHVLLIAGSSGMVGAAILAGRAALRAGAGLLTVGIPASQAAAVHASLPEALVVPLAEEAGHICPAAVGSLASAIRRADVLAIGPGISRADAACRAAAEVLAEFAGPTIVDADALYAASRHPEILDTVRGRAIITPHPGELSLLTGVSAAEIDRNRATAAPAFAEAHGVVTVLKGRPTAIALPRGRLYLNPTGNTGLATGGSGDVLTGILAGLVASGASAGASLEDAALVGPYVHGLAAGLFGAQGAERSLLPSDVVDLLPQAFLEIERCA